MSERDRKETVYYQVKHCIDIIGDYTWNKTMSLLHIESMTRDGEY